MSEKSKKRRPRRKDYKKIIDITQSILYTPKKASWFCNYLELKEEFVKEALEYLCYTEHLEMLSDKTYAVAKDLRLKVRGIYHSDGENGHVHADIQRRIKEPIFVPEKWSMGAKHGDRVEIAIEGDLKDFNTGAVHEIVNPWGDYFVGKLMFVDGKWYVNPLDTNIGNCIQITSNRQDLIPEELVYAHFLDAEQNRKIAFDNASYGQQKKTILWSEICTGDKPKPYKKPEYLCEIVKKITNEEEIPDILYNVADNNVFVDKKKGKPYSREKLGDLKTYLINDDLAISFFDDETYVHVPDVTEYIDKKSDFLPEKIKEITRFKLNEENKCITVKLNKAELFRSIVIPSQNDFLADADKIISDANDKVAMWFDEREAAAPYISKVKVRKGETMYLLDENSKGNEFDEFEFADFVPFDTTTVPFCNPFQNFLSVLTQISFSHCVKQHTKEEDTEFSNYIREKCALNTYRVIQEELYRIAEHNSKIHSASTKGEEYSATYLYETKEGDGLLYCNGAFGLCEGGQKLEFGTPVSVTYEDISTNRLDLYYHIKRKFDHHVE